MRISDWSSDGCSADLDDAPEPGGFEIDFRVLWVILRRNLLLIGSIVAAALVLGLVVTMLMTPRYTAQASMQKIGRASCGERECKDVLVSVDAGSDKQNYNQ